MSIDELISEEVQRVPDLNPAAHPIEVNLDPDGEIHLAPAPATAPASPEGATEMN